MRRRTCATTGTKGDGPVSELEPLSSYHACRDAFAARLRGEGDPPPLPGGEATPARPHGVEEKLLQCVWSERLFAESGLALASGQGLEIIDPGRWNHESGPDFLGASLRIDGQPVKGDVEIHVDARDWKRHGHHEDFEYNRVVLHAVLLAPDGRASDRKHNGQPLDRFVMGPCIRPDLDTIRRSLNPEDFPFNEGAGLGRCALIVDEMSDEFMERYLDLAARERMESKVRRLQDQAHGVSLSQVFYQSIMTAMGHKGGKALYFLLARRTPLDELADFLKGLNRQDRRMRLEAILLHVANLIPPLNQRDGLDETTRHYLEALDGHWNEAAPYFTDRIIPPTQRWLAGIRPVNFPPRRLSGVGAMLTRTDQPGELFDALAARFGRDLPARMTRKEAVTFLNDFSEALQVETDGYWSRRYTFRAAPAPRPMQLIGQSRAQSIILNAFLPMLILKARQAGDEDLERKAWVFFHKFPRLQENTITRTMRRRLFSDPDRARRLLNGEARQQGLFYLFHDCCASGEVTCDACAYLRVE